MEKELSLYEVFRFARDLKNWQEFKQQVDLYYNNTPLGAVDESTYRLVKNNSVLDDVSCCDCVMPNPLHPYDDKYTCGKCGGEIKYDCN